jgi:hypothetical protein
MAKIGLIELPAIRLIDQRGHNWTAVRRSEPLVSKLVLSAHLRELGHSCSLFNLKAGNVETNYGEVQWRGRTLTKQLVGHTFEHDVRAMDVWALTANYIQEREPACDLIRTISKKGGRILVGGSDALSNPAAYLQAGAAGVVLDKSGGSNKSIIDHFTNGRSDSKPAGIALAGGECFDAPRPPMNPQRWPVPSISEAESCLGTEYWEASVPANLLPIGSMVSDIGCDRACDFCQTPLYKTGYQAMTPERVFEWLERQKAAGARSIIFASDQFLGRVLWDEGRREILEIMRGVRKLGLAVLWGNGLELRKATVGRGFKHRGLEPDEELIEALWGWDGKTGCYHAYLPAERPTFGAENYEKLLPWNEHCRLLEAIVRTGIPRVTYGVIIGFPEDSHESLTGLEKGIEGLRDRLLHINPTLVFDVTPYAIRPIPGTPQDRSLRAKGLLRFDEPAILGGFWTACADTLSLSYEEVSNWQSRLIRAGNGEAWKSQGLTALEE